ncbi:MAG: DMT family transporter [Bacteroidaceae bacterium]|nr:DMT family transporter [Bacteroidaceae bacterium]
MPKFYIHIIAILCVAIWGETFVSTKVLLSAGLFPADAYFYRFAIAYISLLCICHKKLFADSLKDEILIAISGVLSGSLYFLCENFALIHAQAADVSIVISTCPIFTSLLLALFYKSERLSVRQNIGLLMAFVGLAIVIMNGKYVLHISAIGYSLAFAASFSWGLYSLIMKGILPRYSTWFLNRKAFFYGLITILPYFAFVKPLNTKLVILIQPPVYGNLIYLGVVGSMLCYVTWSWAMQQIGIVKSSIYLYLNPIFTVFFAIIVLHERITLLAFLGLFILLLGMYWAEKK